MGKIDMCNFWSRKGEVSIAPHFFLPTKNNAKNIFEQLLFLKHLKIRSSSRDISLQRFHIFLDEIDNEMQAFLLCCTCQDSQKSCK
jgi:adenylate cyclase class IV